MPALKPLKKIPARDAETAQWLSDLVDTVNALVAMQTGGMSSGSTAMFMAAIAGGGARERFQPVKIEDVRLTGNAFTTTEGPAYWPSQVKYRVLGINAVAIDQDNLTPYFGRPVKGDSRRIYPASKGDTAFLERDRDAVGNPRVRLWLIEGSEIVAVKRCGG